MEKNKLNFQEKCLIIGSGSIGERHAKNLIKFFDKQVIVLSRNPKKSFRDSFLNSSEKIKKISLEELKSFEGFDLLIIATPSSIRSNIIEEISFLNIRIVYSEVPAAISFSEWLSLKKICKKIGADLFSGYNMRFHPGIVKLKSLHSDDFLSLRGVFGEYLPDLHQWEDYKFRYEALKKLGGGPLLTSHHEIDIAIFLMGKVKKVSCIMRNTHLDIDSPDHIIVNLFHLNNSVSNLDLNFFYKNYVRRMEIATSNEIISYEPFSEGLKIGNNKIETFKNFDFNQTYIDSIREALSREVQISPSLESIDHLMKVTDACLKSSKNNGKIIKV